MLKKDALTQGKLVEAEWKHAEKGKRSVAVGGKVCFLQMPSDACGRFLAPYEHLHFE